MHISFNIVSSINSLFKLTYNLTDKIIKTDIHSQLLYIDANQKWCRTYGDIVTGVYHTCLEACI